MTTKNKYKNEALNIIQEKYPEIDFFSLDSNGMFMVGDLVDTLGWDMRFITLPPSICGYTNICNNKTIIFLNEDHEVAKNYFTIAREICYYVLHGHLNTGYNQGYKYAQEEREKSAEANALASKLLMPEHVFIKVFDKYKSNFQKIASIFIVRKDMCIARALDIGLINCI